MPKEGNMAHRRVNGEGTIYRRRDGRYEAAVYVPTASGGRKRARFCTRTWEEAHEKLVAAKAESQRGIPAPDRSWKIDEYLDYWLEHAVLAKRRPLTYRRNES